MNYNKKTLESMNLVELYAEKRKLVTEGKINRVIRKVEEIIKEKEKLQKHYY